VAVAYTDVQALATEFASVDQTRIESFIARAQRRINSDFWGDFYDDAVLYLTAHLLRGASGTGGGGPVVSESAGPLSRSYAVPTGCPSQYAATPYGVEYWSMLQSLRYKSFTAL
jgi:hypothetical protein